LKAAIEQQNADIEELRDRALSPRRVKRYQRMQTQLEQTKRALDELSGQYERQSTEMAEALGTRTILSSSIARLLAIIQEQELLQNQVTNSDDVIQIMSEIEVAGIGKICRTKGFSTPEK
jgi:ATP-dependent 26S proteasome regulatory subunit